MFNPSSRQDFFVLVRCSRWLKSFFLFEGVSPILATVLLGVTINSGRTCISPQSEHFLHFFWEILAFLANTVLFVMLGIITTETAMNFVQLIDVYYLIFLYFVLNFIRYVVKSTKSRSRPRSISISKENPLQKFKSTVPIVVFNLF
jgi:NhaP-type Na+/H+ or K+/H+ antiporter